MKKDREWFECWFDTPYYHLLYKERNEKEAQHLLDQLIVLLKPSPGAKILDVACGKGRHALYLNQKGYSVTGYDLSPENIEYDRQFENETLSFFRHDMRKVFRDNQFDYVFNLFSSFGYFDKEEDNAKTIFAHAKSLKTGGKLVLDYMNSTKVRANLVANETKQINGISFLINRKIENDHVIKTIRFSDHDTNFEFHEQLYLFGLADFEKYFNSCQLHITNVFGDYDLQPFDQLNSDRLLLIAKKTAD